MVYNSFYTYYIEALTPSQRSKYGSLPDVFSGLSPPLYSLIGYFARHWQTQTYIIGGLNLGVAVLLLWLPGKVLI